MQRKLIVDRRELVERTGINPYLALNKEEIDHFFASVPVNLADENAGKNSETDLGIRAVVILHYNYNWMIFSHDGKAGNERILGLGSPAFTDHGAPLFLDRDFLVYSRAYLESTLVTDEPVELKMAGLFLENRDDPKTAVLDLVCVARMRNKSLRVLDPSLRFIGAMGSGELDAAAEGFEPVSRFLIGKLYGY